MTEPGARHVPVLVAGGGPAGLTLARVLQQGGVPCAVLERDPSPAARVRGGPLDLHADSGQVAVRRAGLSERWRALARSEDEVMTLLGRDATLLARVPPSTGGEGNPEIDRTQLRDLLLDALEPDTVVWGAGVEEVEALGGGRHAVRCADGRAFTTDLLVGADGVRSRVRPLLSAAVPAYCGVTFVGFTVDDLDARPDLAAVFGRGTVMAQGPFRGLGTQRLAGGGAWAYAMVRVDERWGDDFPADDPRAARDALHAAYPGWSPRLLALIDAATPPFSVHRLRALPVGHSWTTTPGLTLVGDAAHVMSPFGGQGANLAMLDASDLAGEVVRAWSGDAWSGTEDLAGAVAAYEAVMVPRAAEAAAFAQEGVVNSLDADAPAHTLAFFRSFFGDAVLAGPGAPVG